MHHNECLAIISGLSMDSRCSWLSRIQGAVHDLSPGPPPSNGRRWRTAAAHRGIITSLALLPSSWVGAFSASGPRFKSNPRWASALTWPLVICSDGP